MPNWKLQGHELVWDEEAPDPVEPEPEEYTYPRPAPPPEPEQFNPGDHNIEDVKNYVNDHPDEAQRILDAEVDGKNRTTLVDWLTAE